MPDVVGERWEPPTDTPWGRAVVARQVVAGVPLWFVVAEITYPVPTQVSGYMLGRDWAERYLAPATILASVYWSYSDAEGGSRYTCFSAETGAHLALEWDCIELFDFQTKGEDKDIHRDILEGALHERLPNFLPVYYAEHGAKDRGK